MKDGVFYEELINSIYSNDIFINENVFKRTRANIENRKDIGNINDNTYETIPFIFLKFFICLPIVIFVKMVQKIVP